MHLLVATPDRDHDHDRDRLPVVPTEVDLIAPRGFRVRPFGFAQGDTLFCPPDRSGGTSLAHYGICYDGTQCVQSPSP